MGCPEAIELANADKQAKTLLECRLHHMARRVGRLLAQRQQPVTHLATQLERMSMPPIVQGRDWIGLETLAESIDRSRVAGDNCLGLCLLHRVPVLEISQEVLFGSTALSRCHRGEHGEHWIVETKGQENVDVARKDKAAALWCENTTELTGTNWRYLKVPQKHYEKLQPADFADLQTLGLWEQGEDD